ncbi:DUF6191 domain-containing protein [Saccharothrix xinjiangensis]|uniref:DUF6191 domain-containing protein n=1 Tax=Saccharothrix xinjiangensis TaxID=204798 RepID=A0ABV9XRL8_9PSEU
MGLAFALSIPGLAVLLVALAAGERLLGWVRRRAGRHPVVSATAFDEFTAIVHGSKRVELDQRQTALVLGEDEESGAPPRGPVDLDSGSVRLSPRPARPE